MGMLCLKYVMNYEYVVVYMSLLFFSFNFNHTLQLTLASPDWEINGHQRETDINTQIGRCTPNELCG